MGKRKPSWLKTKLPSGEVYKKVKDTLKVLDLHTVCEESGCPNLGNCWATGTATFMILGDICTRNCRFCSVKTGNPNQYLDSEEPERVAEAAENLDLDYVVLTSVDRDDLPDGGSGHFAKAIRAIQERATDIKIESLIPDFQGKLKAIKRIVDAKPDVVAHNVEMVKRLTPFIRDRRASYDQSLEVLSRIKILQPDICSKSSLILGLGERKEEVFSTMEDLREANVDFLTLGQYLQPTKKQVEVDEYITPKIFDYFGKEGERMGFKYVASGPLVRSSYKANEFFSQNQCGKSIYNQ